jgi:hypothetical protein
LTLKRYTILVLGVALATMGLAWPLVLVRLDEPERGAVALGSAIAVANAIVARGLVLWGSSAQRSSNAFLGVVLGGMIGRMAAMLLAVVAAIVGLGLPKLPLTVSLLSYFVVFLIMELSVLNRHPGIPIGVRR